VQYSPSEIAATRRAGKLSIFISNFHCISQARVGAVIHAKQFFLSNTTLINFPHILNLFM
jgi:hypothetical protein